MRGEQCLKWGGGRRFIAELLTAVDIGVLGASAGVHGTIQK